MSSKLKAKCVKSCGQVLHTLQAARQSRGNDTMTSAESDSLSETKSMQDLSEELSMLSATQAYTKDNRHQNNNSYC